MDECDHQTVYRAGTLHSPVFEVVNNEVWLIKNPALYYPLDNQDARQRHSPTEAVNPPVRLWEAVIKCHPKRLVIKDHPMFKGVCLVNGKQKELKKFIESLSWEKSSVPQCRGGLSTLDFYVIGQAVLYYMIHNPPTTPEDFNFHAELKAASHWHWPKDDEPPNFMPGPHDDLRLKKVAGIALKSWKEKLAQLRKQADMNDENTDSSDDLDEDISDLEEIIFNLSMYYKGTLEDTDDDYHKDDRSPIIAKRNSTRRSPRRKRKQSEEDDIPQPAKRSSQGRLTHDSRPSITVH